ncbi:hypothetical protein M9Y10_028535 [Tritrichomonas musculus]|uniref:Peptidase S8/S53 domain-containing protein n=1 Tax=Tritrichomonas musculus TaxID=1915356 RepID=A0ABR2KKC3_9EUKA
MLFILLFTSFAQVAYSLSPSDNPLFNKQYYLQNEGNIFNGIQGEDLNVVPVWKKGNAGQGVHIVIINDGCQANHTELKENFDFNLSYNYETDSNDPSYDPRQFITSTGTKLATIAAGSDNKICGIGIAYKSSISCINVLTTNKAQKSYKDGIKRDKNVNRSIRVFPSYSQYAYGYCFISDFDKNEENFFSKLQAIYISSVRSGVIQANEDLNFLYYPANPYILTFAEISQRGGRTGTSLRGNVILASVVTGGNDYDSTTALLSAYISTGDGFGETCSETVSPIGTGGAMAAGVISLILSATDEPLQRNDIVAIIALTSAKNDPYSKSWKDNYVGIRYSSIYGFGRLDAEAAVTMARWYRHKTKVKIETAEFIPNQKNDQGSLPLKIPSFLSGFFDVKLQLANSKIKYIDFVELILRFSIGVSDYSLFRIYIISPMGTKRLVKDIAPINEPELHTYRITARDFFGETAKGNWTVRFLRENVGPSEYMLEEISLQVSGYGDKDFSSQTFKMGSNPFQTYSKIDATLSITVPNNSSKSEHNHLNKNKRKIEKLDKKLGDKSDDDDPIRIPCNSLFHFKIETDDEDNSTVTTKDKRTKKKYSSVPFDLVLTPYDENGPFERFGISYANVDNISAVYCMYQGGKYKLRGINPVYQVATNDVIVELVNDGSYDYSSIGFGEIQQYRKIEFTYFTQSYTLIPINILRNNRETLSNYKVGYIVLATLWNIETNKIYDTQLTQSIGGYYIYKDNVTCPKCILTVTPLEIENEETSQCNTFVNALSIVDSNSSNLMNSVDKFEIPWNDVCPLPKGLLTPTPLPSISPTSQFTPDKTFPPTSTFSPITHKPHTNLTTKLIIIIVVGTCVLVGLIIFLIFWQVRKKININPPETPLLSTSSIKQ